jgi:hypothetical protein
MREFDYIGNGILNARSGSRLRGRRQKCTDAVDLQEWISGRRTDWPGLGGSFEGDDGKCSDFRTERWDLVKVPLTCIRL